MRSGCLGRCSSNRRLEPDSERSFTVRKVSANPYPDPRRREMGVCIIKREQISEGMDKKEIKKGGVGKNYLSGCIWQDFQRL